MCLARSNTPAVTQRPDPTNKYKDGNIFDPLPEPEETTTDTSSTNSNNNTSDNEEKPPGWGEGTIGGLTTGLTIPSPGISGWTNVNPHK
mgnify:CR=1 FL=1